VRKPLAGAIIGAGDDDQSIYSLRRATPEGIRHFPNDYPGCADYPLSITQRCGASPPTGLLGVGLGGDSSGRFSLFCDRGHAFSLEDDYAIT
jgi:hypothetical protein